MQVTCPCCGGAGVVDDDPVARLRAECELQGIRVLPFGLIEEPKLCLLMGKSRDYLRKLHELGQLPLVRITMRGRTRCYELAEVAEKNLV